ncbi:uncharacterized protein LOC112544091 [Pelodiscus sinensis]|uniref:uncharacterized protein LOC112544091 n=1 Tax=Pelodiscus sinensis TaxID=13735 RepID=UPI003F6CCAD0
MGTRTGGAPSMGQIQSRDDVRADVHHSRSGNQKRETTQPNSQEQSQKQHSSPWDHASHDQASGSKLAKRQQQNQTPAGSSYGQAEVQQNIAGNKHRESKQPNNQEQSEKEHSKFPKASVSKPTKAARKSQASPASAYGEETLDKLKMKRVIPKIIVTGPLDEEILSASENALPESKPIKDIADSRSNVHTKPSTGEAHQVKKETA